MPPSRSRQSEEIYYLLKILATSWWHKVDSFLTERSEQDSPVSHSPLPTLAYYSCLHTFPHCFKIRPFQFSLLWFSLGLGFTRDTHLSTPMFFIWVIWLGVPNPQRDIWQVWSPLLFAMIGERLLHWHLLIRERPKTLLNILQSTEQLLHHKHTQQRIIWLKISVILRLRSPILDRSSFGWMRKKIGVWEQREVPILPGNDWLSHSYVNK